MRYFCKKALAAAALLLFFFAPRSIVFGQSNGHFEWAQGFGTGSPESGWCHITGSLTDSLGNFYFLGQFRNDSEWGTGWDAELLLPMTPYGPWPDNVNTIIAKISPDGEMVWKKVIHSNNGSSQTPIDIKKVGDTAFACMVEMLMPNEDRYVYYLDTLIPGRSDYPVNSMYVRTPMRTAFIMFDFEGNVLEQHFLYQTYTDTAGNDFGKCYDNDTTLWLSSDRFRSPSFDIDADGNIYICRASMDRVDDSINAANGTIHGIKFWVDNRMVGEYINENIPRQWYPQIMKFSPHFDTMLACRYIVQSNCNVEYNTFDTETKVDKQGNVYIRISPSQIGGNNAADTIVIDSLQNIYYTHCGETIYKPVWIQFDSILTPRWVISLDDSIIIDGERFSYDFYSIDFDDEENLFFLSGEPQVSAFGDTTNMIAIFSYQGIPIQVKNNAFFLVFRQDSTTPVLYSYGKAHGIWGSCIGGRGERITNSLVCKNNRVFMQCQYFGGMRLPGHTIRFSSRYDDGMGLTVFDYDGNVIEGVNYNSFSPNNLNGPIALHDSILYLSGTLRANATFGDIPFSLNGTRQKVYIAKYVDTSFITPYVKPTVNITTAIGDKTIYIYPNPARDIINLNIGSEPILEVSAISISGIKTPLIFNGSYIEVGELQQGLYILETVTPTNKYHSKFIKL